jgi:hypothetical protein
MFILVPCKPVVAVWLILSVMILAGYVASTLMQGKPLFAPYSLHRPDHGEHHRVHRPA